MSLMYGVSPQPAQAPENSNSGLQELAVLDAVDVQAGHVELGSLSAAAQLASFSLTSSKEAIFSVPFQRSGRR
jgi:hypothetical protein